MAHLEERMIAIGRAAASDESLEGVYRAGARGEARGAVIAPPHPLYGGSIESPVVNELSWAAAKSGIASIAFNWRGVGASAGAPSGEPDAADEDYAAALDHLGATVDGGLLACGYSFGAAAAVRAAEADTSGRIGDVLLVAPPPALIDPERIAALPQRVLVVSGALDELAPRQALSAALLDAPDLVFEVIAGADHFFMGGLGQLGRIAQQWIGAGGQP